MNTDIAAKPGMLFTEEFLRDCEMRYSIPVLSSASVDSRLFLTVAARF